MSQRTAAPRLVAGLALGGLALCACATGGVSKRPVAAPPPVVMAPIPNPPAPAPAPPRMEREPERPAAAPPPAPRPAPARQAAPAPAPAASVAAPPADATRAARLRGQALEQLNRGAVDRAVALLEQAQRLNPASKLIARDLARARRIASTVHARK